MAKDIKCQINVRLADHTAAKDELTDKIFTMVSGGGGNEGGSLDPKTV